MSLLVAGSEASAAPVRTLVLVGGAEQRELAARIKGQTADVDAAVATVEVELPAELDDQIAMARAARSRADVVVWFGEDRNGDRLAYIARGDRLVVRRIHAATGALSRSASIEAAALAVRTALVGFATGAEVDPEEGTELVPSVRPWASLGWTGTVDGTGSLGHGVALRAGAARGRWRVGALVEYHPSVELSTASASIRVGRQQAALLLGADLVGTRSTSRWGLGLELGLGAVRFPRTTVSAASGLLPTPESSAWSPLISPGVRVARRLSSKSWLSLDLGADVLSRPPEFGVQQTSGFEPLASTWGLEPRVAFSFLLDWR